MVTTQQYHRKSPLLQKTLMLQQQSSVASELTLDLAKKLKGDHTVGVARKPLDHALNHPPASFAPSDQIKLAQQLFCCTQRSRISKLSKELT